MKIKTNLKNIIIGISTGIILLIILLLIILSIVSHKPVAAFYGINSNSQQEIVKVLQTTHVRKNKHSAPFEIITLDNSVSLAKAVKKAKKPDLLFVYNGLNADSAIKISTKKKAGFDVSILKGMTTAIHQITPVSNNKVNAVPLLINNYEVDVNLAKFNSSSVKSINVLSDLEELGKITKSSTMAPIIFAGAEDESLINIFGALVEATSGIEAWNKGKESISAQIAQGKVSQNNFFDLLVELSANKGPYHGAASLLKSWSNSEIMPKNIYQIREQDVSTFLSSNLSTIAFMNLSEHRTFERSVISKYSSGYIPGTSENEERHFTAPVIFAVPMSKDKVAKNAVKKMAYELQSQLSHGTGLAPVQANCSVPDIQADDVRYWVAASGAPLPALSDALFINRTQRNAFAEALRAFLRIN